MITRLGRRVATLGGVGLVLLGASLLYHAPSLFMGVVSVEDDLKVFYFPLLVATAHALSQGQLAVWTPAVFGGYPLFADGEAGMLYPLHLLLLPWATPEVALVLLRVVHSVLGAGFAYLLLRTLGAGQVAGLTAGLVYAYSGFAAGQVIHANVFHGMVWLPLQLALVEQAFVSTSATRVRYALLAGSVFGIQALAVHIHVTLMSGLVVALFVGYRALCGLNLTVLAHARGPRAWAGGLVALATRGGIAVGLLALIGMVGVGIAAVQLLPLAELGAQTARGSGLDARAANVNSLWWGDLLTLLLPRLYDTAAGGYWGPWVKWETVLYVGIAPLALAAIGLLASRGRHRWFFAALGALGLLLAFGSNTPFPAWNLLHALPGFDVLRSPGRFSLLLALAIAVLAGHGVERLAATPRPRPRVALAALLTSLALCLTATAALAWASRQLETPTNSAWLPEQFLSLPGVPAVVDGTPLSRDHLLDLAAAALDPTGLWPAWQLLLLPATGVAIALWLLGTRIRPAAVAWSLALVFVDLWLMGLTFHPYIPLEALRPHVPPVLLAADGPPARVYTPPTAEDKVTQVEPNRLLAVGLQEANGYSSLEPDRHAAYVAAIQFTDNHLLDLWNVRYVIRRNRPELLPSYAGTSFHPQRPLFSGRAATAGAGGNLVPDGGEAHVNEVILISSLWNAETLADGQEVARVILHGLDGETRALPVLAGRDVSDTTLDVPGVPTEVRHGRAPVAFQYQQSNPNGDRYGEQLYAGTLSVDPGMTVTDVEIQPTTPIGGLQIYGVGLYDAATSEVTQARQKRKFTLVHRDEQLRVYENAGVMPRAFLVPQARVAAVGQDVLAHMVAGPFDPRVTAIVEDPPAGLSLPTNDALTSPGTANVVSYRDDAAVIRTAADHEAVLVLTDTFYPGWVAEIDGRPAPILRTDYLFRGVVVPPGEHVVTFSFRPWSVSLGASITLLASLLVLLMPLTPILVAIGRRARLAKPVGWPAGATRRAAEPMAELP